MVASSLPNVFFKKKDVSRSSMKVSLFAFNEPNLRKNSQSLKKFQTWDSPCQHEVENSDRNFDLLLSQSCGKFYKIYY